MKEDKFIKVLVITTILLLVWQLFYMIDYASSTNTLLPTQVNLLYLTWKQSYDEFLAVPNFFLIPLSILLCYIGVKRLKQK